MSVTMSISTGFYPNLDLKNVNKLHYITHSILQCVFKTTWGIINKESGKNKKSTEIPALKVEGKKKSLINKQTIAETFNEYFVAIA